MNTTQQRQWHVKHSVIRRVARAFLTAVLQCVELGFDHTFVSCPDQKKLHSSDQLINRQIFYPSLPLFGSVDESMH